MNKLKSEIIKFSKLLNSRKLSALRSGNISVRFKKGFFISFLIKFIILSINPAYPQKKPERTADVVSFPITFVIFFKSIFGIKDALSESVLREI